MKLNEISKFKKTDMDIINVKDKGNYFEVEIVAEYEENATKLINYVKERKNMKVIGNTFDEYYKGYVVKIGYEKEEQMSDSNVFQKFRNVIEEIEGVEGVS